MHSLANEICEPSHGKDVASAIQIQRVIFVQTIASNDLIVYRVEARIVRLKWMRHFYDDTVASCGKSLRGAI
jgi:hypothetical protein